MRRAAAACAAAVMLVATGCGASHSSAPTADPKQVAVKVLGLIVHNRYTQAWDDRFIRPTRPLRRASST